MIKMNYLVFISNKFQKSAVEELKKEFSFKILKKFVNFLLIDSQERDLVRKFKKNKYIFTYSIAQVEKVGKIKSRKPENLFKIVRKLPIRKTSPLKIEFIQFNGKRTLSAKDFEVYFGENLERLGYNVNIKKPSHLLYLAIIDNFLYYGYEKLLNMSKPFIDPYRHYKGVDFESRARFKLIEALDEFEIKSKRGIAIDLGAAPGGWSSMLAGAGLHVLAIDPGNLDDRLVKKGIVKIMNSNVRNSDFKNSKIVHLKMTASEALHLVKGLNKISLIVDDMNINPRDSANTVISLCGLLKRGTSLIFTIKCVTKKVEKYILSAMEILEKEFSVKKIRWLPHNRQEVTLFAVKK